MVFVHRSVSRAVSAAQTLRAAPVSRGSAQTLGRRFASTGKAYEEHKSSDLPWCVSPIELFPGATHFDSTDNALLVRLLGSVGLGGPMIVYLIQSGPEKKPHGDGHGIDHISEKTGKQKEIQESRVDGEVLPDEVS